jgi:gamma-glutamylcyclotransferase (GGCT)/AIG2-like uncharacterized protein YtfP
MKQGDLLLVYGTLRKGQSADLSRNSRAEFIGVDQINGLLYELGWFPGVKTVESITFDPDKPTVTGDVFKLHSDDLVEALDSYEGYPNLYSRVQTTSRDGRTVWVYVFNGIVHQDNFIPDGNWVDSKDQKVFTPRQRA